MDTPTVVGVVGIAVGTAATVWSGLYAGRKQKEAKAATTRAELAEAAQKAILDATGFKYDLSIYRADIETDGTCKITRVWRGVKVVNADLRLPHVPPSPSQVRVPNTGACFKSFPTLLEEINFKKNVRFNVEPRTGSVDCCQVSLEMLDDEGLTAEDPVLNYGYAYTISNAFLMTKEAAERAYSDKHDVVKGEALVLESEAAYKIEVELTFPPGFRVDPQWGVKLQRYNAIHKDEYRRIQGNRLELGNNKYRFTVEFPLSGCQYFIHWWPPSGTLQGVAMG